MNGILNAYLENRAALRNECAALLREQGLPEKFVSDVFWEDFLCDEEHIPFSVSGAALPGKKFNAPDFFSEVKGGVERVARWKRLCVTTTWLLNLRSFRTQEDWFESLSPKNRKKLRWLRNAVPKLGAQVRPLESEADFDLFESLYSVQFPKHAAGSPENRALRILYRRFIEEKRSFSRLLLAPDGSALAACLAYVNGNSLYYTHLTRTRGEYDKFSPGYYLTYAVIRELLEGHPEISFFFLGPGEYDYKNALGGTPYPVYRYERNTVLNLFGLIRLYHRAAKERASAK